MVPNFHSGEYLIIDQLSYQLREPRRGEVVVLKYPFDSSQRFIKRIIGLPGETVEIKNGKVSLFRDGAPIDFDESRYLPSGGVTNGSFYVVLGNDQYFVMGDNRQFSYDSRGWGPLPRHDIVGRALMRVFPLSDMGIITGPSY